jgi:hypothetical protein
MLLRYSAFTAMAPVFGAALAAGTSPRSIAALFIFNITLCLFAIALIGNKRTPRRQHTKQTQGIGLNIAFCICIALAVFLMEQGETLNYTNTPFFLHGIFALLLASVVITWCNRHHAQAILPGTLLRHPHNLFVLMASFFYGGVVYGMLFYLPYYLSVAHDATMAQISAVLLIAALPQVLMLQLMRHLILAYPNRRTPAGGGINSIATTPRHRRSYKYSFTQYDDADKDAQTRQRKHVQRLHVISHTRRRLLHYRLNSIYRASILYL